MMLQCTVSPSPTELYTPPVCDFCGARQGKFRVLLRAVTGAAICNQCAASAARQCAEIIERKDA